MKVQGERYIPGAAGNWAWTLTFAVFSFFMILHLVSFYAFKRFSSRFRSLLANGGSYWETDGDARMFVAYWLSWVNCLVLAPLCSFGLYHLPERPGALQIMSTGTQLTDTIGHTAGAIVAGYLLQDLVLSVPEWRKHWDYLLHHIVSLVMCWALLVLPAFNKYVLHCLIMEFSTLFYNTAYLAKQFGVKQDNFLVKICLGLFFVFFFWMRVLRMPLMSHTFWNDASSRPVFDDKTHYFVAGNVWCLTILQVYWFFSSL